MSSLNIQYGKMLMETVLVLLPVMFLKHFWTTIYTPRGRFLGGVAAKVIAVYEAAFYAALLTVPLGPLLAPAVVMALIHWAGAVLYFRGALARYKNLAPAYAVFEAVELLFLVVAAIWLARV
ncbi:hypothetical protein CGL51_12565 [Pyrobaculum aerophilum]|uniref:Uncharacterized protein n=2 Tax=Pyrobaculum aerophilum TaxID=13773 RepID=A0A371QUT1_9CREN|nr:hypothetical protein CGL51_12565 [Pyrobaculum aerophilum]RFA99377.1 hypothetical protein CGL52_04145 [Pyrobaculum aerophilum]